VELYRLPDYIVAVIRNHMIFSAMDLAACPVVVCYQEWTDWSVSLLQWLVLTMCHFLQVKNLMCHLVKSIYIQFYNSISSIVS